MARLYGSTTKLVRHVDKDEFTINPQQGYIHTFWKADPENATARSDNQDLENEKICPLGSKITKHKLEMTVTPYTIEPQNLYMGIVKLSFHDIMSEDVCGFKWKQSAYGTSATPLATTSYLRLYQTSTSGNAKRVDGDEEAINWNGTSNTLDTQITDILLDDNFPHFCRPKKVTLFDQRPLMTSRYQRVPSKVKRINDFTYYGLWLFNDSPNNSDAAKLDFDIKSYYEEWAQ